MWQVCYALCSSQHSEVFPSPITGLEQEETAKLPIKCFGGVVTSLVPSSCSASSLQQLAKFQTGFNKTTASPLSLIKLLSLPDLLRSSFSARPDKPDGGGGGSSRTDGDSVRNTLRR